MNLEDQYDRIFKYLYFHLHDRHAAEDLTQEAFFGFLHRLSTVGGKEVRKLDQASSFTPGSCAHVM